MEEPPSWLAELSSPMISLREMSEAQAALAARQARRMNMNTSDMRALRLLDMHGSLGLTDLARHLDLRPASVTSLIDRLESAGLIERVREGDDRRRISVRALPAAQRLSYGVWEPVLRAMDELSHTMSERDRQVVCSYLDRVAAVMRAASD
ncbi:MarR family winged helix-turn-helix transcriptional regulator [Pseudonocardia sp. HH130629-09]|uniref:MarR family winged helix-turn-helix transcriptional regulator n=1 Tax=Pseudonocardia sp. HH130629-09 TaxID=1641402 RepID=UPI0006CB71AC|nr:MarR family transcriptional regulator [Pseudonocardia sp. HH130629-09]ALE84072.1 hypothetical protein XF36_13760 [Pseudonocardia sp. HH130629-09]